MTLETLKTYKVRIISGTLFLLVLVSMAVSGTLSYPFIMVERQVQSIQDCTFGSPDFTTGYYGFTFSVPGGYCVLPNRLFPLDGSIEIVPKAWYFVFNEYAKGTVAGASVATLFFEPVTAERDPDIIIQTLVNGRFLDAGNVTSTTTASGMTFILADGAHGTDDKLYDWALTTHPNKNYFVGIVSPHAADKTAFTTLLQTLHFR